MSPRSWLVVLALVCSALFVTAGPAGAARTDPAARAAIPRTYDQALAHFQNATKVRVNRKFYTPSGNIYCNVGMRLVKGCEINVGRIPGPNVCRNNPVSKTVGRLEFRRSKVQPVCNTDTIRTSNTRTLPYGEAMIYGNISCLSEEIGVTCLNEKFEFGFFLHRGEYVLFSR
ncbi:hypothetical protein [Nocardioides halotolerans]|jgi:hypothetical protein|uniref:hypothetical protein n=1 Tax=Nocardioides halotolerans TaxID=433660 RepID=UPI0003F59CF4|nr:hypothetical protein [Nocardioides halotolerans]